MIRTLTLFIFFIGIMNVNGQKSNVIPGELLVQLADGAQFMEVSFARNAIDIQNPRKISGPLNIYHVIYDSSISFEEISQRIISTNEVLNIMPNMVSEVRRVPNDDHYSKQNNLRKIDIERAWSVTTGGETALGDRIVVAILDSGYGTEINDIRENHYENKFEQIGDANGDGCPGDCGVDDDMDGRIDEDAFDRLPTHPLYNPNAANDDDENGYIDDIWGLNMSNKTDIHPADNHGTAVAGIIGAAGNNIESVSGINWDVDMLLISKVVNVAQIVDAYNYVYDQRRLYNDSNGEKGAHIVVTNFSSGIDKEFGIDFPIWCDLYDLLGSVGILSVGATTNSDRNVDEEGDLPTTCESPYLISVTNLNAADDRLGNAGYGSIHIDLGAPGNGTVTTNLTQTNNVGSFSGTSAAAPHVAGAIALIYSVPCPEFAKYFKNNPSKVTELKEYVLSAVDPASDLVGKSVTAGRLNVYNAMVALKDFCPGTTKGELNLNKVFPNPSYREMLTIEYDGPDGEGAYELLIYDVNGEKVHSEMFNPPLYGEKKFTFLPPTLAHGLYFFVIKSSGDLVTHKHVITPF